MTSVNGQGNKNSKSIWIGLGAAALFCLCAVAVAVFLFYKVGQRVKEGMKTDPASASKAAHQIVDYDLPPGYQEQMSMDLVFYSIVMIGPQGVDKAKPAIMLAQFKQSGTDPKQMEQQIRNSFEQQYGNRGLNMKLVEVKKMTIRGEEVEVSIYEGSNANGISMRQLITTFPGKDGTAMLMVMGSPQTWDQASVDDFIKSIR
jgi:hypothetical protein